MRAIQRKFIITAAVCTALVSAITYLICRTWQSAAIAAGIVILIFLIVAKAVSSLISKGVSIAVDKAGDMLLKLLSRRSEKDSAADEEEETATQDEAGEETEETD